MIRQAGYLLGVGPVFVIGTLFGNDVVIFQGTYVNGKLILTVKAPSYADQLQAVGPFPYPSYACKLGNYTEGQTLQNQVLSFQEPVRNFGNGYKNISENSTDGLWTTVNVSSDTSSGTGTGNGSSNGNGTGNGYTSSPTPNNSNGSGNGTTNKAPSTANNMPLLIGAGVLLLLVAINAQSD